MDDEKLESITKSQLEESLGRGIFLGLGNIGVQGILEKDDKGFYVGGLRGGIKHYLENEDMIILGRVCLIDNKEQFVVKEYEVNLN